MHTWTHLFTIRAGYDNITEIYILVHRFHRSTDINHLSSVVDILQIGVQENGIEYFGEFESNS